MTQTFVEILILTISTITTGFLLWIADVLKSIMNDMDLATFGRFMRWLYKRGIGSAFAVVISTVPMVAMIPYFIMYHFDHGWFTAGLIVFVLSSVAGKMFNLPVYNRILALKEGETALFAEERRKLKTANWIRALICLLSSILMVIQFVGVK
ncbi:MAG: hypothetical protein J2P37_13065 [Ktedonobacteraceae bacterium]|nr:hypothetical protein [Ktedonobacteraceae bacterium]